MQSLPTVEGERRHAKDGDPGAGLACVRDSNREQSVGTGRKSSTDISPWSPYKRDHRTYLDSTSSQPRGVTTYNLLLIKSFFSTGCAKEALPSPPPTSHSIPHNHWGDTQTSSHSKSPLDARESSARHSGNANRVLSALCGRSPPGPPGLRSCRPQCRRGALQRCPRGFPPLAPELRGSCSSQALSSGRLPQLSAVSSSGPASSGRLCLPLPLQTGPRGGVSL
ncbi:hypothetical protein ACRRTK_009824 [Alexandromys fortis]